MTMIRQVQEENLVTSSIGVVLLTATVLTSISVSKFVGGSSLRVTVGVGQLFSGSESHSEPFHQTESLFLNNDTDNQK